MREAWDYDRKRWVDDKGNRWHFAQHHTWESDIENWYEDRTGDRPYTLYFRDDAKTIFGVVRFQRGRDNPYHYDKLKHKIMNDPEFRDQFVAPGTKKVWKRSWK